MDLSKLSERERLVAEQAILTLRELDRAADDASLGHGMEALEGVIHEKGFEHLRTMLSLAANARPEAQKKGRVAWRAGARASSSGSAAVRS